MKILKQIIFWSTFAEWYKMWAICFVPYYKRCSQICIQFSVLP